MIAVCLKGFSKCSLLRCARHFEANFKYFLIGMAIKGNMKYATLDVVFGKYGLVKAENKQDQKKKKDAITLQSEMEKHCFSQDEPLNNNVLFPSYIESTEKTVLWKIIKSSRRKASHISDSQVSPKIYTNQFFLPKKYLLAIPRKKILQNLILSIMYGKVQFIISPLRLKEP